MSNIELADGVRSLPRDSWNALVGDDSPFLEWDWLASLEESEAVGAESGWLARPLVARDGDRILAACPLYVKGNSEGEFVFDHGWADAAERAGIRYYPKLLVGVPFTEQLEENTTSFTPAASTPSISSTVPATLFSQ